MDAPRAPWAFYRSEGCQFKFSNPGQDDPGRPMLKAHAWIANFDLSALELRCKYPAALVGAGHKHRHVRGRVDAHGIEHISLAAYSGKYTPELGTVYAKEVKRFVDAVLIRVTVTGLRQSSELSRNKRKSRCPQNIVVDPPSSRA